MSSFRVEAEISADGSRFATGMLQMEKRLDHFKEKLNHVGEHHLAETFGTLFGVAALEQATHKTIEYGAKIYDLSKRVDVAREDLQKWDYALTQNGSSLEAGVGFFEKLAVARQKALAGSEEEIENFRKLGVSIDDLKNKNLQAIGLQIGAAVKEGDTQKLIAALRGVGGRAAGELVAAFKAGLPEAFDEAEKLGIVIKDEAVVALKEAEDEVFNLAKAFRAELAPAITFAARRMSEIMDLILIGTHSAGAYLGTLSGGGSEEDAKKAAYAAADEVIDQRLAREKKSKEKAEAKVGSAGGDTDTDADVLKRARDQVRLKEKLEEITRRNNLAELSASDRLKKLEEERAAIINRIGPPTAEEGVKAEEIRGEIIALKKHKDVAQEVDSLAKIGGFLGGAASQNPIIQVAQQQLAVQRMIERNTSPAAAGNSAQF